MPARAIMLSVSVSGKAIDDDLEGLGRVKGCASASSAVGVCLDSAPTLAWKKGTILCSEHKGQQQRQQQQQQP